MTLLGYPGGKSSDLEDPSSCITCLRSVMGKKTNVLCLVATIIITIVTTVIFGVTVLTGTDMLYIVGSN